MLRPAMSQIIKKDDSYYRFVVAVAKRAREIAEEAEEEKIPLGGKTGQTGCGGVCHRQIQND